MTRDQWGRRLHDARGGRGIVPLPHGRTQAAPACRREGGDRAPRRAAIMPEAVNLCVYVNK